MAYEASASGPGARKPLGPVGRWFARAPRYAYKLGLGRILGTRFVLLHHIGRTSGLPRETVLEVVRHDEASLDVAAAWGRNSDWFRNLLANPRIHVDTGPLTGVPAVATVLEPSDAATVFGDYAEHHPKAARTLAKTLRLPFGDPAAMAAAVPLVRLTLE